MYTIHTVLTYAAVFPVWHDSIWSKFCVNFAGQQASQDQSTMDNNRLLTVNLEPLTGRIIGRVGSFHENLDQFHIWIMLDSRNLARIHVG